MSETTDNRRLRIAGLEREIINLEASLAQEKARSKQYYEALQNQLSYHRKRQSAHAQRCYADIKDALNPDGATEGK